MNYSQDEFFELMDQIEEQGGNHLDAVCTPKQYGVVGDKVRAERMPRLPWNGCNNSALFDVPFLDDASESVVVCAVDDDIAKWPRFGGDKFAKEQE